MIWYILLQQHELRSRALKINTHSTLEAILIYRCLLLSSDSHYKEKMVSRPSYLYNGNISKGGLYIETGSLQMKLNVAFFWSAITSLDNRSPQNSSPVQLKLGVTCSEFYDNGPDSKIHGTNMGPIWDRQGPGGSHVGPMNFAIWGCITLTDYPTNYFFMCGVTWPPSVLWFLSSVPLFTKTIPS